MNKYDMLIICGLPRAGTTFLNNIFSHGAFGPQYYGHHANKFKGLGKNPCHLCESSAVNMLFRGGVRCEAILQQMTRYWRDQIDDHERIIVYKHPQLILQMPFISDHGWRPYFIFCYRDFQEWKASFEVVNGHMGMHPHATDSHWQKYWPGNWREPEDLGEREEILYNMIIDKIKSEDLNNNDRYVFHYSRDRDILKAGVKDLIDIFDDRFSGKEITRRSEIILNTYWRAPK